MTTARFLEYLQEHPASRVLSEELAGVLVLRGRRDLVPKAARTAGSRRIAS